MFFKYRCVMFHYVKYSDLPADVKLLMDSLKCGTIDFVSDKQNITKNEVDEYIRKQDLTI